MVCEQAAVMNLAIQIEGLAFSYDPARPVLQDINFNVADNEFVAILGQNGSGKTTLLKCITALLRQNSGEIFIRGKNTRRMTIAEIAREVGFVTQNPDSQLFADTVFNEAAFALKNAGLDYAAIKIRVEEALAELGLEDKSGAFPPALSRADRAKTVIASVLAMGAKILLFDEPDAGQDYRSCVRIMRLMRDLHARGYTVIFITHNVSLAAEYGKRLVIMDGGKIAADGDARQVLGDAAALERLGIVPPQITRLSRMLRKDLPLERDALSPGELADMLIRLYNT
jgi:energy-coupling factor transport system ATP-binding protein